MMTDTVSTNTSSHWVCEAIRKIEADFQRSADTHLIKLDLPYFSDIDIYLKDESTHPTGSLKHRLARSLFLYGLCNGWIKEGTTVIESSSGSTAISEAYFARLLGLRFIAVVPCTTAKKKIEQIQFYGGEAHFVDRSDAIYAESRRLAKELNGHYMDQFTYAERATDWRSNNNIANSIFGQMKFERYPVPSWIVMSPGTGGTSATIGRFIRYRCHETQLLAVDPENSVFHEFYKTGDCSLTLDRGGKIEGIGRPRVEPSFIPGVIDRMETIADADSVATVHWLEGILGRKAGASTGTNLFGALKLAEEMQARGEKGSIVTLLCDSGDRYLDTYFDEAWVEANIGDVAPTLAYLQKFGG
ncbi:cysteine synthase [Enterovibrio norvegicus FF-33]|uniref:L-cysteine desulfhydrase Cds1 n=1 Tax=Enterovibrio norvegicus FF-454 TaxID=1185651 RepID=A0A1E5CBE5_9GAMM|nr:PLP-dependent cysteine synthase family protein [Enterovibrio norvegicus]OEE62785.1 cysteine synthase [Enterovibrio norvegicus FF-454]OEE70041.1 cysteine synthase [Enterovibrio norvegicus FF-33]OEE90285.1 cysteine synthase [Enterovibrio norvegicus FF-162]